MQKITLSDLNPPNVVVAKTYFWSGMNANSKQRSQRENYYETQVENWLKEVVQKYGLNNLGTVEIKRSDGVYMFINDDCVASFRISISRKNFYKHQNFKPLLSIIKTRLEQIQDEVNLQKVFYKFE